MTAAPSPAARAEWRAHRVQLPKTAEVVAQVLRRQIVSHQLREGDALPSETVLLEQFGVARQTIREALRILESERLLTIRRGVAGGPRVRTPNRQVAAKLVSLVLEYEHADLADVYRAQDLIESLAIADLAERRSSSDLDRLRSQLDRCEAAMLAEDRLAFSSESLRLKSLFVELGRNVTLSLFHDMASAVIRAAALDPGRLDRDPAPELKEMKRTWTALRDVVDRIGAGDPTVALDIWDKHSTRARRLLLNAPVSHNLLELMEQSEEW